MAFLYPWIRYVHILAGFLFLMAHGTSVYVAYQLKKEKDMTRMQALMDVSAASWPTMMLSLLALLLAGIILAFMGGMWGRGWVWASLVLLLIISIWMFRIGQGTYHPLRKMLGMEYLIQGKPQPVEKARPLSEIQAHIAKTRPREMMIIGVGGFALILWLMLFKPF